MISFSGLSQLNKSQLYDFCHENVSDLSSFPWSEKKYVGMKYFLKVQLLNIARKIYSNKYLLK